MSAAFGFLGALALLYQRDLADYGTSADEYAAMGMFGLVSGLVWGVACFLGARTAPDAALWKLGLVLICLGMATCCLPACLPLLIAWVKPDTQEYFRRPSRPFGSSFLERV